MAPGIICGFLSVIYFQEITNKNQFETFQKEFKRSEDIKYRIWSATRKKRWRDLHAMVNYTNNSKNGERERYCLHFSLNRYKELTDVEQQKHNFNDCKRCLSLDVYYLKKSNILPPQIPEILTTPEIPFTPATPSNYTTPAALGNLSTPVTRENHHARVVPKPRSAPVNPLHSSTLACATLYNSLTPTIPESPPAPAKTNNNPAIEPPFAPTTPDNTVNQIVPRNHPTALVTPVNHTIPPDQSILATPENCPIRATTVHPRIRANCANNSISATPRNNLATPNVTTGRLDNSFQLLTAAKPPTTPLECATFVNSVIKAANEILTPENLDFHNIYLQKQKMTNDPHKITKSVKRNILKGERDAAIAAIKEKDFVSLYASPQSEREWDVQRRDSYGVYRKTLPKSHTSKIDSYKFSEGELILKLNGRDVNSINYTALAKEVNLVNREGNIPSNAGQVMKEIARSLGYDVTSRKRKRVSWLNHAGHKLNIAKKTSSKVLKKMKTDMIEAGEVDIGEMVVPLEYEVMTIDKDGSLKKVSHHISGRKFNLRNIRQNHLERMVNAKVMRQIDWSTITDEEVETLLTENGEIVMNNKQARESLKNLSQTRHLILWHDHSEILGKSHYLFVVWFLYDELVYLKDTEFQQLYKTEKKNIQGLVEKPYVYLLAQSGASVKDQLLYVPTRLEDIEGLNENLTCKGKTYKDIMRLFSGDTPARQLEAGQQCGGSYPCPCGKRDLTFGDTALFNSAGPLTSMEERESLLRKTDTWVDSAKMGNIAPFDSMKMEALRNELINRGETITYEEKSIELKGKLVKLLKGVKRPAALHTAGEVRQLQEYEVLMVEPLHDLKNVINRIFDELPHAVTDPALKEDITNAISILRANNRDMKGSDCRGNLIKLAKMLATSNTELPEGRSVINMLSTLVDIQKVAYSRESDRNPRTILRAYNQCFVFAIYYIELFSNPKANTKRAMFGMPFHALTSHLPETIRLVNGISVVAEQAERQFNQLRQITLRASNRKPEDVVTNALFRLAVQRRKECSAENLTETTAFELQQSAISKASFMTRLGHNTIISHKTMEKYKTATLSHLKRVADYLERGSGVWYKIHSHAIEFLDGDMEPNFQREGPGKTSFRSTNYGEIRTKIDRSWKDCLRLKVLPIVDTLMGHPPPNQNQASHSDSMTMTKKPPTLGELCIKEKDRDIEEGESTSFVCTFPIVSTEPENTSLHASLPTVETQELDGAGACTVTPSTSHDSVNSSKSGIPTVKEIVRELWLTHQSNSSSIFRELYKRKEAYGADKNMVNRLQFRQAGKKALPHLQRLLKIVKDQEKMETLKEFKETKVLLLNVKRNLTKYGQQAIAITHLLKQIQNT